jgi:SNF2 family DNA or RNA helicase
MTEANLRLLPGAEQVLDAVAEQRFVSREAYQLQLQAARMLLLAGFEELACLGSLNFEPFGYQVKAARAALRRFRGRGLLCDEVGLGKTIEAGLVLKEYILRQMVRRVLILTPPALVEQWREELETKFRLTGFVTNSDREFRELGSDAWAAFPRVIASVATARRAEHREVIAAQVYDLVIVDEAHHLKNRATVTWKLVNSLQKKYILLLTATPVQNDLEELYNLITILKPGQLKTPSQFRRQFVVQGDPRLPKNRGRLRELLADVMVRHSRSQVDVQLPPRRAHTVRLPLTPEERTLYDDVSALVRAHLGSSSSNGKQVGGERETATAVSSAHRFTLRTLQRAVGSSPLAARPTLLRLAEGDAVIPYRKELLNLADRAAQIQTWSKANALEKLLLTHVASDEKLIIFTHFLATLDLLAGRLRDMGIDFVLYHGGLSIQTKDETIRRFEQEARVLLSTEAAGEGRNLQFCRTMVNFDLPWNPMRIEQRVGRIHRVGQTHPVQIFNLAAEGTVEDYILDVLDRKLNMFELVIGEMDMILGQLGDERDFEEIVIDLWTQAHSTDEASAAFEQLGDALARAREGYQHTREYDEALFGEDFTPE